MPRTKVGYVVNVNPVQTVPVELVDGRTVFLGPRQILKDVEVLNLHRIKNSVRVEEAIVVDKHGPVNLTEVMPKEDGQKESKEDKVKVNLIEVKPSKSEGLSVING